MLLPPDTLETWLSDLQSALNDSVTYARERHKQPDLTLNALINLVCEDREDFDSLTRTLRRAIKDSAPSNRHVISEELFDSLDRHVFLPFLPVHRRKHLFQSHQTAFVEQVLKRRYAPRRHELARVETFLEHAPVSVTDLTTAEGFTALVFNTVYEPALRADADTATANLRLLRAGFAFGHDALSSGCKRTRAFQRAILLLIGAFSLYRMGHEGETALVAEMRDAYSDERNDYLLHGILAHRYFHNLFSEASSHSLDLIRRGRTGTWGSLSGNGVYLLRAADLALEQGFRPDQKPKILHGASLAELLNDAADDLQRHGRHAELHICRATALKAHILQGDVQATMEGVAAIRQDPAWATTLTPYRQALLLALEARANFIASRGIDRPLLLAAGSLVRELRMLKKVHPHFRLNPIDELFIPDLERATLAVFGSTANMTA
jgi:hypothetical protein